MELHFKYLDAVQVADKKIEGEKHVCIPACLLPALLDLHSIWVPVHPVSSHPVFPHEQKHIIREELLGQHSGWMW